MKCHAVGCLRGFPALRFSCSSSCSAATNHLRIQWSGSGSSCASSTVEQSGMSADQQGRATSGPALFDHSTSAPVHTRRLRNLLAGLIHQFPLKLSLTVFSRCTGAPGHMIHQFPLQLSLRSTYRYTGLGPASQLPQLHG